MDINDLLQRARHLYDSGALGQTWPARLAKDAYSAMTLPGDAAQGNVAMFGPDGHTSPEVIGRAANLGMFTASGIGNSIPSVAERAAAAPPVRAVPDNAIVGYHGSRDVINKFDPGQTRLGRGVFFADDPKLANQFAHGTASDGDPARMFGEDSNQEILRWVRENAGDAHAKRIGGIIDEADKAHEAARASGWEDAANDHASNLASRANNELGLLSFLDPEYGGPANVTRARIDLGKNHKVDMGGRFSWDQEADALAHARANNYDSVTFTNHGNPGDFHTILSGQNIYPFYDPVTGQFGPQASGSDLTGKMLRYFTGPAATTQQGQ
jgi:hypothetical protein